VLRRWLLGDTQRIGFQEKVHMHVNALVFLVISFVLAVIGFG